MPKYFIMHLSFVEMEYLDQKRKPNMTSGHVKTLFTEKHFEFDVLAVILTVIYLSSGKFGLHFMTLQQQLFQKKQITAFRASRLCSESIAHALDCSALWLDATKSTVMILINATTLKHKSTLSTNNFGDNHFGQKYQNENIL